MLYRVEHTDFFDTAAKKTYGAEKYADFLMRHNWQVLEFYQLEQSAVLNTPDLPEALKSGSPPWRQ
jgi:hypothetical protein